MEPDSGFYPSDRVRLAQGSPRVYIASHDLEGVIGTCRSISLDGYVAVDWDNGFSDTYSRKGQERYLELAVPNCPRCEKGFVLKDDYLCEGCRYG